MFYFFIWIQPENNSNEKKVLYSYRDINFLYAYYFSLSVSGIDIRPRMAARKGEVQSLGLLNSDDLAIDLLEIRNGSESEDTVIERAAQFIVHRGSCVLCCNEGGRAYKKAIDSGQPHRLEPGSQFRIETNGAECHMILIMESDND